MAIFYHNCATLSRRQTILPYPKLYHLEVNQFGQQLGCRQPSKRIYHMEHQNGGNVGPADPVAGNLQGRHDLEHYRHHQWRYAGHWLWPSGAVLCYQPFSECSQLPGLPTTGICGAPPDSICVGEGGHYLRTGFSDENLCGMQWHCSDRSGQYRRCRWSIYYHANGNDRRHQ